MENKIILIEDDEEIRGMITDYLSGEFEVLCGDIGNDPQGSGQHSLDAAVCIVPVGCGVGYHFRCLSNWTSSVR